MFNLSEALERRILLASGVLVKDIIAGTESSISIATPGSSAALGNKLVFAAVDTTNGQEPWISDGTEAGTMRLKDINPGGGSSQPNQFIAGGGNVFFTAQGADGKQEVWRTDGSEAGTIKVSNLPAGVGAPVNLTFSNGKVLFFSSSGGNTTGLWRTDANGAQASINSAVRSTKPLADVNGTFYFSARDEDHGSELWTSNGTTAAMLSDISLGSNGSLLGEAIAFNGQLIFDAFEPLAFSEPWRSNGTPSGTQRLADIRAGDSSSPHDFAVAGGVCYFVADSGPNATGNQIYRTDGASVTRVTSLAGTAAFNSIRELTDFNGTLYFTYAPAGGTRNLYKLVSGTTPTIVGTATGGESGGTSPGFLTPVGNTLFFTALDQFDRPLLFQSDGNTITPVQGIDTGLNPSGLINAGGRLFYQAEEAIHGTELHAVLDVTPPPPPGNFSVTLKADKFSIDEGHPVTFTTKITGGDPNATYTYRWDYEGNGTLVKDGANPTHTYADNLPNDAGRDVRVKVIDTRTGAFENAYTQVNVKNAKPVINIVVPPTFVANAPMPLWGGVADAGGPGENVTVTINWGDKTVETVAVAPDGGFRTFHTYTKKNLTNQINVKAVDKDGGEGTDGEFVPIVYALPDNPLDTLRGVMSVGGWYLGGTSGNDRIQIKKAPQQPKPLEKTDVQIIVGDEVETVSIDLNNAGGLVNGKNRIRVFAGSGDDRLDIDPQLSLDFAGGVFPGFEIYGGAGRDTLYGGTGGDFIAGESGSDLLQGAAGKDVIYGGVGNDRLRGNGGHDFMVGGAGADKLYGGDGNDQHFGGIGEDLMWDWSGENLFSGGAGRDVLDTLSPA